MTVALVALGALVALFLALFVYSKTKLRRAAARYPPAGAFVDAEGARLHYVRMGSGPAVLLVHGSDGVVHDFAMSGLIDRLAARHDVVAFDRPGHGHSERPEGRLDLAANVRCMRAAVRELGIERPVLVGHSFGGAVVLRWALEHPDELTGVVHLAGGAYAASDSTGGALLAFPEWPVIGPLVTHLFLVPLGPRITRAQNSIAFSPDPLDEEYERMMEAFTLRPRQFRNFAEENRHFAGDMLAMQDRYPEIRVPLVIVVGESDRMATPEHHGLRLHREVAGSELIRIAETGHEIHHKHPEAVEEAIGRVLRRSAGG